MTYVIALLCIDVKDFACVEECPVETIYNEEVTPEEWADYDARSNSSTISVLQAVPPN